MAKNAPVSPVFTQVAEGSEDDFDFDSGADPAMRDVAVPGRDDQTRSSNLPDAFSAEDMAEAERDGSAPERPGSSSGRDAQGRFARQQQEQSVGDRPNEGAPPPRQQRPQGQQPQGAQREESGDVVFPPELLREAGMTEQQARHQFQTPDVLERALAFHDSQLIRSKLPPTGTPPAFNQQPAFQAPLQRQQYQQPFQPQPSQQVQQQGQQQQQQGYQPQEQQQPTGVQKFNLALDPAQYEPEVIQAFNGLNDHYHQQLQRQQQEVEFLRNAMGQVVQSHRVEAQKAYYNEFDQIVNSLGDEYKEVFGEGSVNDLDRSSPHWQNRAVLDNAVLAYQQALSERGMAPVSTKTAILKAVRAEFPQQYDTTIRNGVTSAIGQRQRQFSPRPAGRRTGNPGNLSPEALAISNVERILQERGHESPLAEQEVSF